MKWRYFRFAERGLLIDQRFYMKDINITGIFPFSRRWDGECPDRRGQDKRCLSVECNVFSKFQFLTLENETWEV